jgi:TolB-like protein
MRRIPVIGVLFLVACHFLVGQQVSEGEVNKKIDGIVNDIVEAYRELESAKYRNSLAVMGFEEVTPEAKGKRIGFGASELLETRLSQTGLFQMVERKKIEQVMNEIALGMTGLITEESAAKAGKILGADIMVVGSISELGEYFNLNVRLIEVETGKVLVSAVAELPKEAFLARIHYVKPKRYRFGIGYTNLYFSDVADYVRTSTQDEYDFLHGGFGEDKDVEYTGYWFVEFSYELSRRIFWDVEAGLYLKSPIYYLSGYMQPSPISLIREKGDFLLATHLNVWLWDAKTLGLSFFAGGGFIYRDLEYQHWLGDRIIYTAAPARENTLFPILPVGFSFFLYQYNMVSVRFDMGYQFAGKTRWEYPLEIVNKPNPIIMDPSGLILGTKVRLYF